MSRTVTAAPLDAEAPMSRAVAAVPLEGDAA